MRNYLLLIGLIFATLVLHAQTSVVVNPDGTHSIVINNGSTSTMVNSNGTHSVIINNGPTSTIVNPDGTHSIMINNGSTSTIINPNGSHSTLINTGSSSIVVNQDDGKPVVEISQPAVIDSLNGASTRNIDVKVPADTIDGINNIQDKLAGSTKGDQPVSEGQVKEAE